MMRQMQMGAQAVREKINNETERIKSERQAEEERERERQQIFGPLEKVKAAIRNRRKRKGGKHSIPALAAPAEEQQFGNTDEIAAESADAVDETEDYAGLEDVEPEFPEQDALSSAMALTMMVSTPAFASNLTYNFFGCIGW